MKSGEKIKQYRKAAGLTQKALAEQLGIATITLQQYERGQREPKRSRLKEIAKTLNISFYNLLDDDDISDYSFESSEDPLIKKFNNLLPSGFRLYYQPRLLRFTLQYPDSELIPISKTDMQRIIDTTSDYVSFTLESLKKTDTKVKDPSDQ